LHPASGTLNNEAGLRGKAELCSGLEEDHRVGLAAREISTGDVGVEELLQRQSWMKL
jgi:hypothetical protein